MENNRLPSTESLAGARERIIEWWQTAYIDQNEIEERFVDEAVAALPGTLALSASPSPEDVLDGLMLQRVTLKRDQQLAGWICC